MCATDNVLDGCKKYFTNHLYGPLCSSTEPPSAKFFFRISNFQNAHIFGGFRIIINVTSDSDSIKVIMMAKIHCHCF